MLTAALLLLVAGVSWIDHEPARRAGAAGLVAFGLAVAASDITPGGRPPPEFLAANGGLFVLGLVACGAGLVAGAWRARGVALAGPLLGSAGVVLGARSALPTVLLAGAGRSLGVAATVGAVATAAAWVAGRTGVGEAIRRRSGEVATAPLAPPALAGLTVGVLAVGFGGHVAIMIGGAVLGAWAAWLSLPRGLRPRPVAPLLVLLPLGAALWLLATIAGPEGLSLRAIPWLPLSAAAERLLAPLLLLAAWALSGLWPLRQPAGGVLTAPLGAMLLLRLGIPALPAGLEHWRAAIVPLALLGVWHSAVTRQFIGLMIGAAFLGLASVEPGGLAGAGWLLLAGVALELMRRWGRAGKGARPLVALVAAWGGLGVLRAGLRTEVVYTVLAAAAALVALAGRRHARAEAALTPHPAGSIFGRETG